MSIKSSFEKELKNKLLMKTVGNQSEEMVLLRAFKYFDLSNTNLSDKRAFINAVMKIGITGFTEQNLSSIFESYDTEKIGKINYKDFIGILYNNPSIMDNPNKLNEMKKKKQDYPYAPTPSQSRQEDEHKIQNLNERTKYKEEEGEKGYQNKVYVIRYNSWNNDYYYDLNQLYLDDGLHLNEHGYVKIDSVISKIITYK